MTKKKPGAIRGRPPAGGKTPVRQLGRVPDDEWEEMKAAAESGGKSFTQWAVEVLLKAARKISKR